MSGFSDIATGYRRLAAGNPTYGLLYTCNGGWLDLGHAFAPSRDPQIGAVNLWRQILNGGPDTKTKIGCVSSGMGGVCVHYVPIGASFSSYSTSMVRDIRRDGFARFPDGSKGYRVTFRQEQPYTGGLTKSFLIRHGLTVDQKRRVALSIFMQTSRAFEQYQYNWELGGFTSMVTEVVLDRPYDSGFSQEDLVSNLIGFYVAVGLITRAEAINQLHPASQATAEFIWNRDGSVGSNKNRTFSPRIASVTSFDDEANNVCRDDCALQPKSFPAIFKSLTPSPHGVNHLELRPL